LGGEEALERQTRGQLEERPQGIEKDGLVERFPVSVLFAKRRGDQIDFRFGKGFVLGGATVKLAGGGVTTKRKGQRATGKGGKDRHQFLLQIRGENFK